MKPIVYIVFLKTLLLFSCGKVEDKETGKTPKPINGDIQISSEQKEGLKLPSHELRKFAQWGSPVSRGEIEFRSLTAGTMNSRNFVYICKFKAANGEDIYGKLVHVQSQECSGVNSAQRVVTNHNYQILYSDESTSWVSYSEGSQLEKAIGVANGLYICRIKTNGSSYPGILQGTKGCVASQQKQSVLTETEPSRFEILVVN